jgi:hypothetical protein
MLICVLTNLRIVDRLRSLPVVAVDIVIALVVYVATVWPQFDHPPISWPLGAVAALTAFPHLASAGGTPRRAPGTARCPAPVRSVRPGGRLAVVAVAHLDDVGGSAGGGVQFDIAQQGSRCGTGT